MLELFTELIRSRPTNHQGGGHLIPEFDPEKKVTTADHWLNRINITGEVHGWNGKYKLVTAFSKLKGSAQEWFETCLYNITTWDEFSRELLQIYPKEIQFGKALEEAAIYKSQEGQDLQVHCIKKIGLLSNLNIKLTEQQMAQYVAHGIRDDDIRQAAVSNNCNNVNELQKFLSNFDTTSKAKSSKNAGSKELKSEEEDETSRRSCYRDDKQSKDAMDAKQSKVQCYQCDGFGHYSRNCPSKPATDRGFGAEAEIKKGYKKFCTFCELSNHETEKCWFKDDKIQLRKRR